MKKARQCRAKRFAAEGLTQSDYFPTGAAGVAGAGAAAAGAAAGAATGAASTGLGSSFLAHAVTARATKVSATIFFNIAISNSYQFGGEPFPAAVSALQPSAKPMNSVIAQRCVTLCDGWPYCCTASTEMFSVTSSPTYGAYLPALNSVRLICAVALAPQAGFFSIG